MKKIVALVAFMLIAAAPAGAQTAQRAAIVPVSGINVHPAYLSAAQDIFRGHLLATGKYLVTVIPGAPTQAEPTPGAAVESARGVSADVAVVLHVTRLGSSARVRLTVYDARSGQAVHRDELEIATPDDMDPALARLAKGLASGKPASDTADIYTVTEKEGQKLNKIRATNVFGVKLGAAVPFNTIGDSDNAIAGVAAFWLYDVRTFLAEVDVGFHSGQNDGDFYVGIGAYYPFTRTNTTPFVGGGLAYSFISSYGQGDGSGLRAQGTFGMLIGRLSNVQLRGDISYFIDLYDQEYTEYSGSVETMDTTKAHGILLNLGIGF
ncbi:MAG TPA: hypothetical protein VFG83_07900 [Kofleriaceae bacterium]|nr:hypothetical protein [Kofleriaceae bacterium]